mgnify:CR=1 FL=1
MLGVGRLPAALVTFILGDTGGFLRAALRAELALVHRAAGTRPAVVRRSGLGLPHSGQNFPVAVAPQAHFQLSPAGLGSGFLLPQLGQKLPVMPLWPQLQVQPCTAGAGA